MRCCLITLLLIAAPTAADPPSGFTPLFNGRDLTGWKVPAGDNGHWKVVDGAIDYDARSESKERDRQGLHEGAGNG